MCLLLNFPKSINLKIVIYLDSNIIMIVVSEHALRKLLLYSTSSSISSLFIFSIFHPFILFFLTSSYPFIFCAFVLLLLFLILLLQFSSPLPPSFPHPMHVFSSPIARLITHFSFPSPPLYAKLLHLSSLLSPPSIIIFVLILKINLFLPVLPFVISFLRTHFLLFLFTFFPILYLLILSSASLSYLHPSPPLLIFHIIKAFTFAWVISSPLLPSSLLFIVFLTYHLFSLIWY